MPLLLVIQLPKNLAFDYLLDHKMINLEQANPTWLLPSLQL
jgi:hypothetical protein